MRRRTRIGAFAVAAGVLALSPAAFADAPAAPSVGEMDASMRSYFAAEKTEGWFFIGFGVASIGLGAYLLTRPEDFARGAAIPAIAVGALQAVGVGAYAFGVDAKVDHLGAELAHDPRAYRDEELARMSGVTRRFVVYRIVEIVVLAAGAGLVTAGFLRPSDALKGAGVTLAAQATILLTLDFFADARAHAYKDEIERFSPPAVTAITASVGAGASPWLVGYRGTFW
jgi:hypothetical protein